MANQRREEGSNPAGGGRAQRTEVNGEDSGGNGADLVNQAKTAVSGVYETVADKAASAIDDQKAGLTGKLSGIAETVRRVGGTLHEKEEENPLSAYAARYSDTAAEKIESVVQYFNSAELKDIARDLETYARRNPAVFLGSAFAIGIMAARFLKSTPPSDDVATRAGFTQGRKAGGGREQIQTAGASQGI